MTTGLSHAKSRRDQLAIRDGLNTVRIYLTGYSFPIHLSLLKTVLDRRIVATAYNTAALLRTPMIMTATKIETTTARSSG